MACLVSWASISSGCAARPQISELATDLEAARIEQVAMTADLADVPGAEDMHLRSEQQARRLAELEDRMKTLLAQLRLMMGE